MHIFYSFIFVFSSRGIKEKRTDRKPTKREMMFLTIMYCENRKMKTKTKSLRYASCQNTHARVQMVGAYFDLESGGVRHGSNLGENFKNIKNPLWWRLFPKNQIQNLKISSLPEWKRLKILIWISSKIPKWRTNMIENEVRGVSRWSLLASVDPGRMHPSASYGRDSI